jgi:hypothetical protein
MTGLTRSITDRLFVGLLSAVFAPVFGFGVYVGLISPNRATGEDWLVRVFFFLAFECIGVLFLVCVLGIAWSIWTPNWIERTLKQSLRHFVALFCAVCIVIATGALLYAFIE